jgi:hypothetical protein
MQPRAYVAVPIEILPTARVSVPQSDETSKNPSEDRDGTDKL